MRHNAHKILVNTLLLTAASLVMRGVGLVFQVYLAGKIGASSLGVYSLIMSVYSMFVTLGSGGIRFAVTRLTAAAIAERDSVRRTVGSALLYALTMGLISLAALFFAANFIGERWIGSTEVIPALKILAMSLPFIPLSAVFGGYFTGVERVVRSVSVNIAEQISRILVTVALLNMGGTGIRDICASLAAAAVFGEMVSCAAHILLYLVDIRRFPRVRSKGGSGKKIFGTAMPIAISAYMRTGLSSLGHILIPRGLRASGASFDSAFAAYGAIHGMAFPVLLFPSALLTALAELIIPRLTAAQSEGLHREINYISTRVIKIGLMFSICIAEIMLFFGPELGQTVYGSGDVGRYLQIFAPLIPVMYCDMVTDGCLKGLGQHMKAMYINIAEATLNVLLLYFLIPRLAVTGYGLSIYICESFNLALSFGRLLKVARIELSPFEPLRIMLAGGLAGFGARVFGAALPSVLPGAGRLTALILISAALYIAMLYILRVVEKSDIRWFRSVVRAGK